MNKVLVWDRLVRAFHWTTVLGIAACALTAEFNATEIHIICGYVLTVTLVVRIGWGFFGSQYARFRSFTFSFAETNEYVRGLLKNNPPHYYGHNPAGAVMVYCLLVFLLLLYSTGLITAAAIEFEGPLQFLTTKMSNESAFFIHEVHETLPWLLLALIFAHLMGVIVATIQHEEKLIVAMVTGKKNIRSKANEPVSASLSANDSINKTFIPKP